MKSRILSLLSLFALGTVAAVQGAEDGYLFTSFRGDGDGLHLAYSLDGHDWTDLNRNFLTPTVGSKLLRDPHILRGPDGLYHLVWTSGWNDKGIGYATSKDLVNWSEQRFLPLMESVPHTQTCWAPELYFDDATKSYILVWSSAVGAGGAKNEKLRAYYSLTKDFQTFTPPKILFDPGFNNLDTTMLKVGDKFVILFKEADDQPAKKWGPIHAAIANRPLGPYKLLPVPVIKNLRVEGPSPLALDGRTLLYVDFYVDGRYGAFETKDWKTWTDVTGSTNVVPGQRHGSILRVPGDVLDELRKGELAAKATAPRPILGGFTADPSIRVFGDTYYIYPTTDLPNWNTKEFAVWSSKNLVDWKKEGVFMDLSKGDVKWADNKAWAPDCIERGGKYYFYFCADHNIGVAVGNTPVGPFKDALGKPLLDDKKEKTFTIDPYPFIDDDGKAYLYYGNNLPMVGRLAKSMTAFDEKPCEIEGLREFREGIVVFKRKGRYYFMWSIDDARSPNYRVGWGIADSPYGPVKPADKDFIVLQKNGSAVATAHHSVVNVPGTDRWYVAYHRHAIPGGGGYKREVCLARMEFDADGAIKPMDPLQEPFPPGSPGEPLVGGKGPP
jgi:beta-xylosidase